MCGKILKRSTGYWKETQLDWFYMLTQTFVDRLSPDLLKDSFHDWSAHIKTYAQSALCSSREEQKRRSGWALQL